MLDRATILCEDEWIDMDHLPSSVVPNAGPFNAEELAAIERRTIERVMVDSKAWARHERDACLGRSTWPRRRF